MELLVFAFFLVVGWSWKRNLFLGRPSWPIHIYFNFIRHLFVNGFSVLKFFSFLEKFFFYFGDSQLLSKKFLKSVLL